MVEVGNDDENQRGLRFIKHEVVVHQRDAALIISVENSEVGVLRKTLIDTPNQSFRTTFEFTCGEYLIRKKSRTI